MIRQRKSDYDIKAGLHCCSESKTLCANETNESCPYRIDHLRCDRYGLAADALELISELESDNESLRERITNAAKVLGYDCDECDRW